MPNTPSTHWPRVLLLWGCGILAAMQFAKISLAFPLLQQHFGVSTMEMGWALSLVGVVGLSLGVSMGLLAPRIGYRRLLCGGLALGGVLAGLQALPLSFPWFVATRVLEGASHLAVVVAAPTLISGTTALHHRSIAMGLWSTFVGTAFALTAAGGAQFLAFAGLESLFALHAVLLLVAAASAWWALPQDTVLAARAPHGAGLLARHVRTYTDWRTALPGLCFFCYTGMAVALLTFLPRGLAEAERWAAPILPLMGIAGTFGAGWLTRRSSPMRLLQLLYPCLGLAGVLCAWSALSGWGYAEAAIALMLISGLAGGCAFALIPHLNHDSAQQARANGAVAQMGNLGATLGPPLFAWSTALHSAWGLAVPVVMLAALGILLTAWGRAMQGSAPRNRQSH
ncbi:MFS transporter [Rhodoferax sp.]|uniref:MFS transporter n=1 Tax=Rhodoferax sp. TaxID=50421 RepID=UPI0025D0ADAB|nr:MFS transporter [Rhodoferax sp.]